MHRSRGRPTYVPIERNSSQFLAVCNFRTQGSFVVRFQSSTGAEFKYYTCTPFCPLTICILLLILRHYRACIVFEWGRAFAPTLPPSCTRRAPGRFSSLGATQ